MSKDNLLHILYVILAIYCSTIIAKKIQTKYADTTPKAETDIKIDNPSENETPKLVDYSFYIKAPELFPVELFFAEFLLDKQNEIYYSFPKFFVEHKSNISTTRIENAKPIPTQIDMVWYSITENKSYSLQQDLPVDTLKNGIRGFDDNAQDFYDGILLTLEPYGKVDLYAYNSITEKKNLIASYQAKEINLSLEDFRASVPLYENPEKPVSNWQEYQLNAFAYFSKAAEFMADNNFTIPSKDFDFWKNITVTEYETPKPDALNEFDENGETPLIGAIRRNKYSLVVKLIGMNADLNIHSKTTGETALSAACSMGYSQYVKYLITAGADVNLPENKSGKTPLMLASLVGYDEIVDLLIKAGADVNAKQFIYNQDTGYNALKYARENNNQKIVDMLIQAGAKEPEAEITETQETEPEIPTTINDAVMLGNISQVEKLLADGANPNEQIPGLGSLLYYSIATGNVEIVKILVNAKADINAVGANGYTPLMMAVVTGHIEIVKILLDAGADISIKNKSVDQDALTIAKNLGNAEIIDLLKSSEIK